MTDTELSVNDSNKKQKIENTQTQDQDDEEITCMICSEVWKTKGSHCLVSLHCGHLFGKSCIIRWITERTEKYGAKKTYCPMCMKIARLTDIRIVTPIKIAVKDVTQIDLLRRELETKKYTISEYQKSLELARLSLQMRKRELERAQSILEEREMDTEKNVILTRSE